jgi:ATP-dependent helicase/nuclease subunit A
MLGDNPLLVGTKIPDPKEDYDLSDTPVLAALREMQRQKERAEKKRLLYVALTRARDHLIMSGTAPENPELSINLATSRIEWIFSALGITGDDIDAGEKILASEDGSSRVRLAIPSDPASIPAEENKEIRELILVPDECAGMNGTWTPMEFEKSEPERIWTVSELEEEQSSRKSAARKQSTSRYLPRIKGETRGTIIHEVLRGRDPRIVCREYGVDDPEAIRQCEEIVARFSSTDLMQRVKREFCELPFSITFEGKRVVGKIDRLCELNDGLWLVIDYKSEAVSPDEYVNLAKEYGVSMKVYKEAARQLVGGSVEGRLYFTDTGEFLIN